MDILETLKKLNSSFGPSGDEAGVREVIKKIAKPFADDMKVDVMGNLIVHKKGKGPKLMIAAHMDSIGMIVTFIEKDGRLRFGAVGGIHERDLLAIPVRFKNGVVGAIYQNDGVEKLSIDSMFIDIGAKDKAEAEKMVSVGDMAIFDTPVRSIGEDRVVSCYFDNRAGVVATLLALENCTKPYFDTYFVFTVQEELGLRGAKPAAFGVDPEYAIVCDTTIVDDIPKSKHVGTSVVGGGAAIKIKDMSVVCHPEMVDCLKKLAKKNKIKNQIDILRAGSTDGGEMRKNASGVYTGGVSVPVRYVHSPQEVGSLSDIEAAGKLIAAFASSRFN